MRARFLQPQEKFLLDRIKVGGKVGNLGDLVSVSRDKAKVQVSADTAFSKRYLKYLSKKYLKKQQVRARSGRAQRIPPASSSWGCWRRPPLPLPGWPPRMAGLRPE